MSREKLYWIALSQIPNIGPLTFHKLIAAFKGAENVWNAPSSELLTKKFPKNIINSVIEFKNKNHPEKILDELKKKKTSTVALFEKNYPENLKQINDPPPVLYYKGALRPSDKNAIAIVGSRKMTSYGKETTEKFSSELASLELTIVSGMARGVDGTAHQAALDAQGRTIAVLGSGVDVIYPYDNHKIYQAIADGAGAVVSEFPPGEKPHPGHFPQRNRIIAGLALGVLVVEAAEKSGSMITPHLAIEYNREVFAVPGPIYMPTSHGTAALIKQGAKLVTQVEDILEELNIEGRVKRLEVRDKDRKKDKIDQPSTSEEKAIYKILEAEPKHIDQIIRESGLKTEIVMATLSMMEVGKKVKTVETGVYKLT